jgi:hypothetical protein
MSIGPTIITYPTRTTWSPLSPDPALIRIEDVARSLALQVRFGGHIKAFYSIAQHSVLVSRLVPAKRALCGLLHEIAEALSGFGDVLTIKSTRRIAEVVKPIEHAIEDAAAARFGLPIGFASLLDVKAADRLALAIEDRDLRDLPARHEDGSGRFLVRPPSDEFGPIEPWEWQKAEEQFLQRFHELGGTYADMEPR